jgi:nucleoside diphosphate kinase
MYDRGRGRPEGTDIPFRLTPNLNRELIWNPVVERIVSILCSQSVWTRKEAIKEITKVLEDRRELIAESTIRYYLWQMKRKNIIHDLSRTGKAKD